MSNNNKQSVMSIIIVLIMHHIYPLISETVNCDNAWSDSTCRFETVSCNDSSTDCSINCNGDGSCDGSIINCNPNTPNNECNIYCLGKSSCRGSVHQSIIHCPSHSNCNIYCNGLNSCESIQIYCPSHSNCTMHGNGEHSLINSYIHCPSVDGQCLMNCNNDKSCIDTSIDGRNASQLTINCADNKHSCKDINIGCPQSIDNIKHCAMIGDQGTAQNGFRIFAVNSWDDIDLTKYRATTVTNDHIGNMMSCTDTYTASCDISVASWNCADNTSICYRDGIPLFPTYSPTKSPTNPAPDDHGIDSWTVAIGLIVGIFLFCLFVLLAWTWCINQRQKEKTKYETLDQAPDPDGDVMQKESQHMYRTDVPSTKQTKSMDIATKGGFHIVNEYSDANLFGGLLPISEEKTDDLMDEKTQNSNNNNNKEEKEEEAGGGGVGVTGIEDNECKQDNDGLNEKEKLISTKIEQQGMVTAVADGDEEDNNQQKSDEIEMHNVKNNGNKEEDANIVNNNNNNKQEENE